MQDILGAALTVWWRERGGGGGGEGEIDREREREREREIEGRRRDYTERGVNVGREAN